ncbi:hypothetical protein GGI1_20958 [Acidithiobacillus sp. GGI-221]|nr:hypothetical protein GGI1_20958 [Acidithiobacillus sp. GGI-221]
MYLIRQNVRLEVVKTMMVSKAREPQTRVDMKAPCWFFGKTDRDLW